MGKYTRPHIENIRDFIHTFLTREDQGMVSLLQKDKKTQVMTLIRCDYTKNIAVDHSAKGKNYPAWEYIVDYSNQKRQELYYTPNTFFGRRSTDSLCSLRACYVDVDCHDGNLFAMHAFPQVCEDLLAHFDRDELPKPYIIHSGRGLHLLWPIEPENAASLERWNAVQKALAEYVNTILDDSDYAGAWAADFNALDCARVLRMPFSYNRESKTWSRIIIPAGGVYSLEEISEAICAESGQVKVPLCAVTFSHYEGLLAILKERLYDMEGFRNIFLTILGSDLVKSGCTKNDIFDELGKINASLLKPLPNSQVNAIARCCYNHGYTFSKQTIVDRLQLSPAESCFIQGMPTTCRSRKYLGWKLAQISGVDTRIAGRHRKEVYAEKRMNKIRKYLSILDLRAMGKKAADIAAAIGVSIRTVRTYWKMTKEQVIARISRSLRKAATVCGAKQSKVDSVANTIGNAENVSAAPAANDQAQTGLHDIFKSFVSSLTVKENNQTGDNTDSHGKVDNSDCPDPLSLILDQDAFDKYFDDFNKGNRLWKKVETLIGGENKVPVG